MHEFVAPLCDYNGTGDIEEGDEKEGVVRRSGRGALGQMFLVPCSLWRMRLVLLWGIRR